MKDRNFFRQGDHCCRADRVGRVKKINFVLSDLQMLEQRAKNCIEFRGQSVEWIASLVRLG
jgi:hypothetical protein